MRNYSKLIFGFDFDREYFLEHFRLFQFYYGLFASLLMHPLLFFLLLLHSKSIRKSVRNGYLVNQVNFLIHDIFTCFVYQYYVAAPYPMIQCGGYFCRFFPDSGKIMLITQTIIIIHTIPPYVYMLLTVNQQLIPPWSKFKLSRKSIRNFVTIVYLILLTHIYGVSLAFSTKGFYLLQRPELNWLKEYPGCFIIHGDVGDIRSFLSEVVLLPVTIVIISPFLMWTGLHAAHTLLTGKASIIQIITAEVSLRTHKMLTKVIKTLLFQAVVVGLFYVSPIFILGTVVVFPKQLSNFSAPARCCSLIFFTLTTLVSSSILLFMTRHFQRVIKQLVFRLRVAPSTLSLSVA